MNKNTVRSVIQGNIETLDQGIKLVQQLTDEQYTHIAEPYVKSSIGQHFRHMADVFFALVNSQSVIDYDIRRRGAEIETSRAKALEEFTEIKSRIADYLNDASFSIANSATTVTTEVTMEQTQSVTLPSTFLRELIFTSSHALHHLALISVLAKLQGVSLDSNVGIAPATATFLRSEPSIQDNNIECAQ